MSASTQPYDGSPVETPKPEYVLLFDGEPVPDDVESVQGVADIWESQLAGFVYAVTEGKAAADHEAMKPIDLGRPEDLKRYRALAEEALADTRVGEDVEARRLLLSAEGRDFDETEIHSVVVRRPGEQLDIDDASTYTMTTEITRWPADPPHPVWNPSNGSPPSGTAFVLKSRTLRAVGAELADRARIRFLYGRDAEELLAPRKPVFF